MTRPYRGDTSGAGPSTATRELVRDDYDDDVVFYQEVDIVLTVSSS